MYSTSNFEILIDKTGFPLLKKEDWNFYISLFPVSKYQFEEFLIQTKAFNDRWYRNVLRLNERSSWKNTDEPWKLFITGVEIKDINKFLEFLGNDYRLPTYDEWKELHKISRDLKEDLKLEIKKINNIARPVIYWIDQGIYPLTEEGLFEMVSAQGSIKYIGKPFYDFFKNVYSSPLIIRNLGGSDVKKYIGFRVVKKK